jgi:hypothetical protein
MSRGRGISSIESVPDVLGTISYKAGSEKNWSNPIQNTPSIADIFFIRMDQRSVPRHRKVRFRTAIQNDQVIESEATYYIAGPIWTPPPDENDGITIAPSSPSSSPSTGVRGLAPLEVFSIV